MAFIPSSTRQLAPDATCRLLAVYQVPRGGKSHEKQLKGYLLDADGNLSGDLILKSRLQRLKDWEEKKGKIAAKETARAEVPWTSADKVSWGAKVCAKIMSLLPGVHVGADHSKAYVACGVRELFFENGYNGFMSIVKPKKPENGLGLVADKTGKTIIFVVVRLVVADSLHVIKKDGCGLLAGMPVTELAALEAKIGREASSELQIVGPRTNPVILKRTFLRMAWDEEGRTVANLHGDEVHDGIDSESDDVEHDEKNMVEVEEEGLLNLEDLLDPAGPSHS